MIDHKRILIVDDMHESIIPLLEKTGFVPDYQPNIRREEILKIIQGCIGLIIRSKTKVDPELIDCGVDLRFIARAGSGMDKIDQKYLAKKNILAINAPEGNRDSLGEHAIGMLLNLLHKINIGDKEIKNGVWNRRSNMGCELKNKTLGIYGYGFMGEAFAKKLFSFDCKIIAYDKFKNGFSSKNVEEVDLDEFQRRTEILSLHIPLTSETEGLFDYKNLSQYPKLKVLINTSRGKVLKLFDVVRFMEEGKLIGLGLDVLENEKLSSYSEDEKDLFERLTNLPNVVLTPHVAGWTFESYMRINEVIVKKIKSLAKEFFGTPHSN